MGFFFLCILAIIGLIAAPLFFVLDYLSELDNPFTRYRDWINRANLDVWPSWGLSFWCFVVFAFFSWQYLAAGEQLLGYALGLASLSPLVGIAAFFRAEQIREERLRSAPKELHWAQAFRFGFPFFIAAAWGVVVRPWSAGGISPIRVAVCSAFVALISLSTVKVIEFDRAHTGRRKIDFSLTEELVISFSVVAVVSALVILLQLYLNYVVSAQEKLLTVREVLKLQHTI